MAIKRCVVCGGEFLALGASAKTLSPHRGNRAITCSPECQREGKNEYNSSRYYKAPRIRAVRQCAVCEREFNPHGGGKTCSPECSTEHGAAYRRKWRASKSNGIKQCVVCGGEFISRTRAKICSPECSKDRERNYNHQYALTNPKITIKQCVICGGDFRAKCQVKTCSPGCRRELKRCVTNINGRKYKAANPEKFRALDRALCAKKTEAMQILRKMKNNNVRTAKRKRYRYPEKEREYRILNLERLREKDRVNRARRTEALHIIKQLNQGIMP